MGVAGGHHKTTDTKTFEYFRRQQLFTSGGRPHDLSLSPRQKVSFTTDPALHLPRSREMHQVAISRHSLPREYPDPLSRSLSSRITAATNSIRGIHPMSPRNGLITCQSKSPGWHKRFCTRWRLCARIPQCQQRLITLRDPALELLPKEPVPTCFRAFQEVLLSQRVEHLVSLT